MKRLLVVLVILLILGISAFFFLKSGSSIGENVVSGVDDKDIKTFILTGENFKFVMNGIDNPDIKVKEGDTIRIEFSSMQGFHDWVVDEFDAATNQIRDTDEPTFVEFVADKKGTFEYYCSVGQHRANGMKGKLVVE